MFYSHESKQTPPPNVAPTVLTLVAVLTSTQYGVATIW